jgi:hypothetical protein
MAIADAALVYWAFPLSTIVTMIREGAFTSACWVPALSAMQLASTQQSLLVVAEAMRRTLHKV